MQPQSSVFLTPIATRPYTHTMNGKKIRAVTLAALMVFSVFAVAVPASAQSGASSDVSITPSSQSVAPGSTVTYDIVVDNAPDGVDSYDYTVTTSDANNASITDFSFAGSPAQTSENYASDNSSLDVVGGLVGISGGSDVVIGTVTVEGDSAGDTADLDVSVNQLVDGNNANIQVTGTNGADVSVDASGSNPTTTPLNSNYDDEAVDASFGSYGDLLDTTVWQGQEIEVNVGQSNTNVELYERVDDETSRLRQQLSSNSTGYVLIDTEDETAGDYFLSGAPALPNRTQGQQNIDNTFSINEQSLTATFDEDSVTDEGENSNDDEFEFDSNRGTYPVTIHANGDLDEDDLVDIFVEHDSRIQLAYTHEGDDGETDYDEIGIVAANNADGISDADDYNVDFDGIDTGDYEFSFVGTDSTAEDTASITVTENNEEASFAEGATQTPAGDIASFEVTLEDTDDTYVQIGSEESNFVDVLYLEVDNADEPITVDVNTRLLGTEGVDFGDVYDVGNEDTAESELHSAGGISVYNAPLYEDDGLNNTGENLSPEEKSYSFEAYLDAMDIIDLSDDEDRHDQLTRPVQPTDYEVVAAGSNDVDAVFDANTGGEANDELGSKVIELQQPEIGEITTHTAPENDANDEDDLQPLLDAATQREEIAIDDQLIVQVEATGLYGTILANSDNGFDALDDGTGSEALGTITDNEIDQIDLTIEADSTTGNQDPLEVDLSNDDDGDTFVVLDEEGGQFFVVVDTTEDNAFANGDAPDSDVDFTASLEYDADNQDDRFEFNDSTMAPFDPAAGADNYPYLEQGEVISSSTEFTLSPRSILFDNLNADQNVQVENIEDAEVSGTTNVAPGSDATIRVSSTDAATSFRQGNDVNITEDGTVSTTFDLSEQEVEDELELNYRVAGSSIDSADGVIVAEGEISDAAPEEDTEEDTEEDSTEEDSTEEDSTEEDSTDDETPGFGAIVALVALIGAALLATRRQN